MHNGETTPLFWLMTPTRRDHVPNGAMQPSILTQVRWTGWPFTPPNAPGDRVLVVSVIVWQYPCENLITE